MGLQLFICKTTEVPESKPRCISAEGRHFAVYRTADSFVVIHDECPHQMASFEGVPCVNGQITCGFHGWVFDLQTGKPVKGFGDLTRYPVHIVGDDLYIDYNPGDETRSAYSAAFIR